jgi:hypothetical protein
MTLVHSLIKPAREVQVGWEIHCADRHDRLRVEWVGRDHRGQVLLAGTLVKSGQAMVFGMDGYATLTCRYYDGKNVRLR